ncbi:MAG TPA: hypothetical protein VLI90_20305 [Tepidisphaeraceae bacterium]|nr:hypothetical protein [Tepidisphaeraceae bacterium]
MTRRLSTPLVALLVPVLSLIAAAVVHAEVYTNVPLKELTFPNGGVDHAPTSGPSVANRNGSIDARIVMDNGAEAYFAGDDGVWITQRLADLAPRRIVIRSDAAGQLAGTIYGANDDNTAVNAVRFTVNSADHPGTRQDFLKARFAYYQHLQQSSLPGAAYFRQRVRAARQELGKDAPPELPEQLAQSNHDDELDQTFGFASGGRAVSENLQLDRALPSTTQPAAVDVKTADLQGVATQPFDWKPLVKDLHPQPDALAAIIPADQHAIFFPSFAACMALADRADQQLSPFISTIESAAGDARTRQRYERQLCLSMTQLGRLLGPSLIDSVAITGSDPYWRVGSDLAVIFQAKDAATLNRLIAAQQMMRRASEPEASPVNGEVAGISYSGLVSGDRGVCSYLATIGPAVVVTNSLVQLEKLASVQQAKAAALSSTPEYTFFRDRYRLGDEKETALLVLSDQTIRRWCSPRWRIGDSRRTRAAAVMSDLQAEYARDIAMGPIKRQIVTPNRFVPGLDRMSLHTGGVFSDTFGSLDFMTPIAELNLDTVTREEADAYDRWRSGYERNFRWFDPIAIRISLGATSIGVDTTVMPLMVSSDYQDVVELSAGAKLTADSADPHYAMAQIAMAFNPKSKQLINLSNIAQSFGGGAAGIDPLAWLGHSASLYGDDDGFWDELAKADQADEFIRHQVARLPVALYVESSSPLKLAAFLTALHGLADQSAPNLTTWETLKHGDLSYVKITAAGAGMEGMENLALYYAALPHALILSLNEGVLTRSMDREAARKPGAAAATMPATQPVGPWLGESYCLRLAPRFLQSIMDAGKNELQAQAQETAWRNIPILNEFKRLLPDQDPAQAYERVFGIALIDGAGGHYDWDEKWQTMQSSIYGSPAQPKQGPTVLDTVKGMGGNFGVTFEHGGLRARAEIELPGQ